MPSLADFRSAFNASPDDRDARLVLADALDSEDRHDHRGAVLRAAVAIHERIGNIDLPDRTEVFWTESPGWQAAARELEALAADPEDTGAFRERYNRIVHGGVPLDPENLEATLRLQYDLQVRLLQSLNLLEDQDGQLGITAVDNNRYPLPAFEDVLAHMQTPELQQKLRQGFDTLLLVPFGLPLDRLLDAWRAGLRRNADTLRSVGGFTEADPLWVWEGYSTEPLVYGPHSFTDNHHGRTKQKLLKEVHRGWDVLLVEGGLPNLPRENQGQVVGGRPQLTCDRTPHQYLTDLQARGESGLTPESYILHFLDALERREQVLDTETFSFLSDTYFPSSRGVPGAYWGPGFGQARLDRGVPGYRSPNFGVRAAVRVG